MSLYREWKIRRGLLEDLSDDREDPAAQFKFNGGADNKAKDYDQLQSELFKTVMTKYPQETMSFLKGLAQRGDQEISSLLDQIESNPAPSLTRIKHSGEPERISPSKADSAHSGDQD